MSTVEQAFIIWVASHANERGHNRYTQEEKAAFMAGYRRALEDAQEQADEIEGAPLYIDADNTVIWIHTRPQIDKWLRDRADRVEDEDGGGE